MTITLNGTTGITTPALDSVAPFSSADMPAGSVLQVVSTSFTPASESTLSSSYQPSSMNITVQKKRNDSRLLVVMAGGHQYVTNFANGCLSTICQESSSSTFTASTTYNSANDPASGTTFGMQQVYNSSLINTAPHSKNWLFTSSGNEFEAFRAFYRSRVNTYQSVFVEGGHVITMTIMEIAQ